MVKNAIASRMQSPTGKIMISVLWGIGIACLFFKTCKTRDCIVIKAPHPEVVSGMIHEHNHSCYEFKKKEAECISDVIKEIENDEQEKNENNKNDN